MNMNEFGSWWFATVFKPYGNFVFVENFGWATILTGVVTAILLGLFYTPGRSWEDEWMDHYGYPVLILFVAMICLPIFSCIFVLIFPGVFVIGGGLGVLMGVYLLIRKLRKQKKETDYDYTRDCR